MQLPLFEINSKWKPTKISCLPDWNTATRIGFDVETKDPELKKLGPGVRRGGYIVGFSFALEDGPAYYVPIRHEAGGNVDEDQALQYLQDQAKNFEGSLVGAFLQYDLDYAHHENIFFPKVKFFRDITIADPLINELHTRYNLNAVAERHGLPGKDESLLIQAAQSFGLDPKTDLWKLHSKYVGPYATQDAVLPLQVSRKQERLIEEQELWEVYNLESALLPALVRMKRRGILIDQERLHQVEEWTIAEEKKALATVKRETGIDIPLDTVWRAEILAPALRKVGITVPLTPQTQKPSITKDFLNGYDNPVAKAIVTARVVNKLRTTFAASIWRHLTQGRIHCNFNQIKNEKEYDDTLAGAAFGRMSCFNPNMQQQPKRGELAKFWRQIYIPDHGAIWSCNDFSQQEPRWVVHAAELFGLPKAKEAGDKYRNDPNTDNHKMMAAIAKIERDPAKIIFLGLIYGMGGPTLCRNLGLPTKIVDHWKTRLPVEVAGDEAQAILDKFDKEVPFVRKLAKKARTVATRIGYIKTHSGRRCRFPKNWNGEYDFVHKALNRYVQGSSGDQAKQAIIDADAAGHYLQLPVHDELDGSCATPKEAKEIGTIMGECIKLTVPMKVDVELGPNWGTLMKVDKWEEQHVSQ